jgi:hypothetical protein
VPEIVLGLITPELSVGNVDEVVLVDHATVDDF